MTRVLRLLALRGLSTIPTLLIVACSAFLLLEFAAGDAVDAYLAQTGGDAGFAAELRRSLGLGGTFAERLAGFLVSLATIDLGQSVVFARPVASVIAERLPNTLLLMASTTLFAAGFGLGLGMLAGRHPNSFADHGISTAALVLLVRWQWCPAAVGASGAVTDAGAVCCSWRRRRWCCWCCRRSP